MYSWAHDVVELILGPAKISHQHERDGCVMPCGRMYLERQEGPEVGGWSVVIPSICREADRFASKQ